MRCNEGGISRLRCWACGIVSLTVLTLRRPLTRPTPPSLHSGLGDVRLRAMRDVYRPLLILVAVGILLRVLTMVAYSTVVMDYYTGDAGRYIRVGYHGVFSDEWQPAGYALFLAAIRGVTSTLSVTVAIQHLLGIATSVLLFATARRAGASRALALIPAGIVLLSGDHLFLEHAFLTESLWMALLAGGLYSAVRGRAISLRWTIAASALLALSAVTRNVSLVLPAALATWALVANSGSIRERLRMASAALVPAVLIVVMYVVVANAVGSHNGLGEMSGWSLYQRVGQFADCRRFSAPAGTQGLCESRPAGQRPGPFFYYWDPAAPARKVFPSMSPAVDQKVGAFARTAIVHQPMDYIRTVAKDLVRYVDPGAGFDRTLSGSDPASMSFRAVSPDPANSSVFATTVRRRYTGLDASPDRGSAVLETYQRVFRIGGFGLLILLALSAVGLFRAKAYVRQVSALCTSFAVILFVLPPAVSSYDARYAIPPAALLTVSAALGLGVILKAQSPAARSAKNAS